MNDRRTGELSYRGSRTSASPASRNYSSLRPGRNICALAAWPFRGQSAPDSSPLSRSPVSSRRAVPESLSAVEPSGRSSSLTVKRPRLTGRLRHLFSIINILTASVPSISIVGKSEKRRQTAHWPVNIQRSQGNWLQSACGRFPGRCPLEFPPSSGWTDSYDIAMLRLVKLTADPVVAACRRARRSMGSASRTLTRCSTRPCCSPGASSSRYTRSRVACSSE